MDKQPINLSNDQNTITCSKLRSQVVDPSLFLSSVKYIAGDQIRPLEKSSNKSIDYISFNNDDDIPDEAGVDFINTQMFGDNKLVCDKGYVKPQDYEQFGIKKGYKTHKPIVPEPIDLQGQAQVTTILQTENQVQAKPMVNRSMVVQEEALQLPPVHKKKYVDRNAVSCQPEKFNIGTLKNFDSTALLKDMTKNQRPSTVSLFKK